MQVRKPKFKRSVAVPKAKAFQPNKVKNTLKKMGK